MCYKKAIIFTMIIALVAASVSFAGCGTTEEATRTVYNLDGEEIEVPEEIDSIAALYGPAYEMCVVLGVEDKIVLCADVQVENFPWATEVFSLMDGLPYLDNVHTSIDIEEVAAYDPDIVFGFPRPTEEKKLDDAGIAYISGATTETLSDIPDYLMVYAEALGDDAVERAEEYEAYFYEKLDEITAVTDTIAEDDRPVVYYAGMDLLTTYGNLCDIPELIEAAGGIAATADLDAGNRTEITFEELVNYDPDYIFIDHGGINDSETVEEILDDTYSDGRYSVITAVEEEQIYLVPSGVFYWDMGLQKILLLMYMAQILHPDLFTDLDMVEEVQEFYETFYGYSLTDEQAQQILDREDP